MLSTATMLPALRPGCAAPAVKLQASRLPALARPWRHTSVQHTRWAAAASGERGGSGAASQRDSEPSGRPHLHRMGEGHADLDPLQADEVDDAKHAQQGNTASGHSGHSTGGGGGDKASSGGARAAMDQGNKGVEPAQADGEGQELNMADVAADTGGGGTSQGTGSGSGRGAAERVGEGVEPAQADGEGQELNLADVAKRIAGGGGAEQRSSSGSGTCHCEPPPADGEGPDYDMEGVCHKTSHGEEAAHKPTTTQAAVRSAEDASPTASAPATAAGGSTGAPPSASTASRPGRLPPQDGHYHFAHSEDDLAAEVAAEVDQSWASLEDPDMAMKSAQVPPPPPHMPMYRGEVDETEGYREPGQEIASGKLGTGRSAAFPGRRGDTGDHGLDDQKA